MQKFFLFICLICSITNIYAKDNASTNYFINNPEVKILIKEMVKKYHFKQKELEKLFANVKIKSQIISNIHAPLENKPWYSYRAQFITEDKILQGVKFWNQYKNELNRAEREFGVPASIIVATIGIETNYGSNKGKFLVIEALSNLAFGNTNRRSLYFYKELIEYLLLTKEQNLAPENLLGSYAGAMGFPQFMPRSYRYYGVHFAGNKNIDLINNPVDAIGSIANYYHKNGWEWNQLVAVPVSLIETKTKFGLTTLNEVSLFKLVGDGINYQDTLSTLGHGKLLKLEQRYGNEYWFTFHNFNVIKRYNNSDLYAMAVYQLSYYITELEESQDVK